MHAYVCPPCWRVRLSVCQSTTTVSTSPTRTAVTTPSTTTGRCREVSVCPARRPPTAGCRSTSAPCCPPLPAASSTDTRPRCRRHRAGCPRPGRYPRAGYPRGGWPRGCRPPSRCCPDTAWCSGCWRRWARRINVIRTIPDLTSRSTEVIRTILDLTSRCTEVMRTILDLTSRSTEVMRTILDLTSRCTEVMRTILDLTSRSTEVMRTIPNLTSRCTDADHRGYTDYRGPVRPYVHLVHPCGRTEGPTDWTIPDHTSKSNENRGIRVSSLVYILSGSLTVQRSRQFTFARPIAAMAITGEHRV